MTRSPSLRRGSIAVLPASLFLVLFLAIPLFLLLSISTKPVDGFNNTVPGFTLEHYTRAFTDLFLVESIRNSAVLAVVVTLCCSILAYPVAWYLASRESGALRTLVYLLVLSPLLTSVVVRSFGWRILFSGDGPVNRALVGLGIVDAPLNLLISPVTTVVVVVHVLLPFSVIVLTTSLGAIDRNLYRASWSVGAGRVRTFFSITLPLSIPGLLGGAMIVFALTMGIYVTPLLVGGANQALAGLRVYNEATSVFNQPLASALSFVLLIVALIAMGVFGWLSSRWERRIRD